MIDESHFLSLELKCGWLLIEIIGHLNSVQSRKDFITYIFHDSAVNSQLVAK